jgi:hypothetical protein
VAKAATHNFKTLRNYPSGNPRRGTADKSPDCTQNAVTLPLPLDLRVPQVIPVDGHLRGNRVLAAAGPAWAVTTIVNVRGSIPSLD